MSESRLERVKRFSEMHVKARDKAGKSQEYMAMELGVAKKTVQNWEKGISSPSFFQSLEWFRVLNIDPIPYWLSMLYPQKFANIKNTATDEQIEAAFNILAQDMDIEDKRALLFIFYGGHGSSAHTIIQLMLAHLHTPLQSRITQAILTQHLFEMEKELDNLTCKDDIMPDMECLNDSMMKARVSALQHAYGYTVIEKYIDEDENIEPPI